MIVIFIFLCINPCRKDGCYITEHSACEVTPTVEVTPTGQSDIYRLGAVHLARVLSWSKGCLYICSFWSNIY